MPTPKKKKKIIKKEATKKALKRVNVAANSIIKNSSQEKQYISIFDRLDIEVLEEAINW